MCNVSKEKEIGLISIEGSIVIMHIEGHHPSLTPKQLREMCLTIDPSRFSQRILGLVPRYWVMDWFGYLQRNTTGLKFVASTFDHTIDTLFRENNWAKYPYVGLHYKRKEGMIYGHYFEPS